MFLKELPVELISNVFLSLDTISDVIHLAQCSRALCNTWTFNMRTINSKVLQLSLSRYDQAQQISVLLLGQTVDGPTSQATGENQLLLTAFRTTKHIPVISQAISRQLELFESDIDEPKSWLSMLKDRERQLKVSQFTPQDRDLFIDFFYQLWVLVQRPNCSGDDMVVTQQEQRVEVLWPVIFLWTIRWQARRFMFCDTNGDYPWERILRVLRGMFASMYDESEAGRTI